MKNITNNKLYKNLLLKEKELARNRNHQFHRYFGKLIPAIPSFAIRNFTKNGDVVLDSFCGSGTTILECKFQNRDAIGVDFNPLAVFIAKVKVTKLNKMELMHIYEDIVKKVKHDRKNYLGTPEPYCVNMDNWFKSYVKNDLLKLRKYILDLPNGIKKDFFLGCFSAFLRGVSNADPMHVFPGYSKRLRKLDELGLRNIDVMKSYDRAFRKRINLNEELPQNEANIKLSAGDARSLNIPDESVNLVVINPPYISSIRYLETMKIEMGWLGFINEQGEYLALDKSGIGKERFYKKDLVVIEKTGITKLDKQVENLINNGQRKMARTVSQYFIDMVQSISEMNRVLKKKGHIVIKISGSTVRGEKISTYKYFIDIAETLGLETVACFKDDFEKNSRSLLTARNSYSGIINHDMILILKK